MKCAECVVTVAADGKFNLVLSALYVLYVKLVRSIDDLAAVSAVKSNPDKRTGVSARMNA